MSADLQPIYNIAEICHQAGITHAVLSPGSRCAPLVIAFARHPEIECMTIGDERSAAFIALGLAQKQGRPVVLICTSGSAVYNYAPAITEAHFRNIPLVVLTADRPPEWIGQQDGQTIWQENIYGKHVRFSGSLLPDLSHPDAKWFAKRLVCEALQIAKRPGGGPVHLNIPFREPFYPDASDDVYFESAALYIPETRSFPSLPEDELKTLQEEWMQANRILILAGQLNPDDELSGSLSTLAGKQGIVVAGDITSNIHKVNGSIQLADLFLRPDSPESAQFVPDLLITLGGAMVSKNIKQFFRAYRPLHHWHIQESGELTDPLQSVTRVIRARPADLFKYCADLPLREDFEQQKQVNYQQRWRHAYNSATERAASFFEQNDCFGEFLTVFRTIQHLPESCNLHLANSMPVRYANYCAIEPAKKDITVFSNRGACGIDGCSSTAAGTALADPARLNVLITGDMAFFYDRNAFWHNYPIPNLRIIVLNNHGGGIFRMIKGPSALPELEPYFETKQALTAKKTCEEFGFEYLLCDKQVKLGHFLRDVMADDARTKIMEVESSSARNTEILGEFKRWIQ